MIGDRGDYLELESVFKRAERDHKDLMEPWSTRMGDAESDQDRTEIMRDGLRTTFRQRFPMPAGRAWPEPFKPREAVGDEAFYGERLHGE